MSETLNVGEFEFELDRIYDPGTGAKTASAIYSRLMGHNRALLAQRDALLAVARQLPHAASLIKEMRNLCKSPKNYDCTMIGRPVLYEIKEALAAAPPDVREMIGGGK